MRFKLDDALLLFITIALGVLTALVINNWIESSYDHGIEMCKQVQECNPSPKPENQKSYDI